MYSMHNKLFLTTPVFTPLNVANATIPIHRDYLTGVIQFTL